MPFSTGPAGKVETHSKVLNVARSEGAFEYFVQECKSFSQGVNASTSYGSIEFSFPKQVQALEGPRGIVATELGHLHNAMIRYAVYLYVLETSECVYSRGSVERSLFSSSHMCGLGTERLAHFMSDYP